MWRATPCPQTEEDEFYASDLVGMAAALADGTAMGKVRAVYDFGAGDVIEIDGPGGALMLPFTQDTVPVVDLGAAHRGGAAGAVGRREGRGARCGRWPKAAKPVCRRHRDGRDGEDADGAHVEASAASRVKLVPQRWTATVLTLFPEMFPGPLGQSLAGRALDEGVWALEAVDIRDYATDKHRTVDDAPFGGGAGMVMRPDVVDAAIRAKRERGDAPLIYFTPRGRLLDQQRVEELAAERRVTMLCGRFEGVDQRVLDAHGAEEISIGDVVLSGGEPAALVLMDAVVRLLPGVVGREESLEEESFAWGLLEYPHYTRPQNWDGRAVPEELLSGHHERISAWRQRQAEEATRLRRPDLWARYVAAKRRTRN